VGVVLVVVLAGIATVAEAQQSELAATAAAEDRTADTSFWLVIGLSALAFVVTAGVAVLAVAAVRPLAALRASARAVTSGDPEARARVSGPEEVASLARDFNAMTDALAAKAQEYIDTTNLTGDIIVKVGKDGRVTFLNDAACEFFGGAREELLGLEYADYVHPEAIEPTAQIIREAAARKELVRGFVNRMITPMGTRVVEWNGYPIFDEEGEYAGFQVTGRDISERKQAEEALRQSEARYRLLAENATDVIWTMDTNLRFTYMSPSVTRLRGYTVEEAMAQTLAETLTPASLEVAMRAVAEEWAIEKMEDKDLARWRTLEVENTCKDGSTVWFEVKIAFLHDEDKRPVGIVGVSRDITQRKRAEDALRQSEERYRRLVELFPETIAVHSEGKIVYINAAGAKLLGLASPAELIGKPIFDFLHPDYREIVGQRIRGLHEEDKQADLKEEKFLRLDGQVIDTEVTATLVTYLGKPAILAVVRDISERKRAEEALRESEEKYRRLVQDSIDAIVIVEGLEIRFVNRAGLKMFGCEREEDVVGRSFADFVSPEYRKLMVERGLAREKGEHVVDRYEFKALRKDGTEFDADMSVGIITYEGRAVRQGIVRDVSERKRAQEALQKVRDELESRVERRMQQVNGYRLTFRELTVLHLVAAGESDKEIATVLGISPLTAHKHLANILEKMGAACRTEAGVRALREGLLD
jgi:PAS domain S-box-containing protein